MNLEVLDTSLSEHSGIMEIAEFHRANSRKPCGMDFGVLARAPSVNLEFGTVPGICAPLGHRALEPGLARGICCPMEFAGDSAALLWNLR